jgi:hypothetical protein
MSAICCIATANGPPWPDREFRPSHYKVYTPDLTDMSLDHFASAREQRYSRRSMTEPLEPDVLSQLRSLVRDHTTFIMGFAEAQKLAARAAALQLLDIQPAELAHRARAVLAPMLDASLASGAARADAGSGNRPRT